MRKSLNVLSDREGSVTCGFLAADVHYFRVAGRLSGRLGIDLATRLREELAWVGSVRLFIDVAEIEEVAFAARSAVMRAMLANRQNLHFISVLVGKGPSAARARSLIAMLNRPHLATESAALFQTQMGEAVMAAGNKPVPVSSTMRVARAMRPRARSLRPRARTA